MATQFAPIRSGATSPPYSRPSTADAFPKRAGSILKVSKRDNGIISPVESTFSFHDDDDEPGIHAVATGPDLIDEKQIARHVSRGAPGDAALANMVKRNQSTREGEETAKRNTQFYGEVFAYREPNLTARDKIYKFSVITAEVKTNVIVRLFDSSNPYATANIPSPPPGPRRIYLPQRPLPATLPTLPTSRLLNLHHPRPLRLPTLRRHLRLCLHPHPHRPPLPDPIHN